MNRHHAGALRRHVLKLLWVLQVLPGITELLVSDSKSEIDVDQVHLVFMVCYVHFPF
jgi:hypothetical protein